jgi:hypothetical protein
MSARAHDAQCKTRGPVQVKITGGNSIAMRHTCNHLIVLKVLSPRRPKLCMTAPAPLCGKLPGRCSLTGSARFP